ncbi:MAG: cell division protein ZipA C-terminal FtsZ-binding domain-containing protein [Pseudomonadota bacterium]|nr:cell division protein ZipA C-terminal FtsZ-binding domain-containing protein [Pseudomonadota bacterium]MDP1903513.1 cell division protein ZipA C-terminal FtsZ-binding domain-containing protein [Pseudomonadota bacterium]MDP2351268.1 cell division protein ZipA C-terminal FtsZ-binding domain-containing protein [Pseudomonadota bacterium]
MMTTLQIVLAIVGIGMIAAIVIFNLVQERRFRKEADRLFSHKRDDIILGEAVRTDPSRRQGETRIQLTGQEAHSPEARQAVEEADAPEQQVGHRAVDFTFPEPFETKPTQPEAPLPPPLAAYPRGEASQARATEPLREPLREPLGELKPEPELAEEDLGYLAPPAAAFVNPAQPETVVAQGPLTGNELDAQTEFIARLKFASPAFTSYTGLLNGLRRIGKPVRAFGLRADGAWEVLTGNPRNAYNQMELGLQLADRGGAVAQDQLDAFCRALYTFAADAGGAVTCPDKEEALARARDLDLFCMNVDVLMGLNVVASDSHPFTSEAIHTQAGAAGLTLERDGVYHARDTIGHSLFTLTNQEESPFPQDGRGLTTQGVTLLFDVPRVADGVNIFDRMTEFGFSLADRLSGRMVDDNGRAVSSDSLNRDRARLQEFYARMEQRDIPAGGERALRLFA